MGREPVGPSLSKLHVQSNSYYIGNDCWQFTSTVRPLAVSARFAGLPDAVSHPCAIRWVYSLWRCVNARWGLWPTLANKKKMHDAASNGTKTGNNVECSGVQRRLFILTRKNPGTKTMECWSRPQPIEYSFWDLPRAFVQYILERSKVGEIHLKLRQ